MAGPFDPFPRRPIPMQQVREPTPKLDRQILDEARWQDVLPRDLTREEWLRLRAPKPRPNYALPHKACWACGVRGHKRGSPDCRPPNAVVCFGCG